MEALRGLVDPILLTPAAGTEERGIELRGNLTAILGPTVQRKRPSESTTFSCKYLGCGGVQPAVLAVVERGCVSGS
jgi:hypothetical protein